MLNSFPCEQEFNQPQELNEQGRILECAILAAVNAIIDVKDKLNDWDSKVGDGDCGSTVSVFPSLCHFSSQQIFYYSCTLNAFIMAFDCDVHVLCRCIEVRWQFLMI